MQYFATCIDQESGFYELKKKILNSLLNFFKVSTEFLF